MDVQLFVYDLSKGLARMYSAALTGTQMDAIYHTSIVLNNVEYYFGQGIQTAVPGTTHHGQPMEIISLGTTELPNDVVEEYLGSLASIYTPESYDLFLHNCNNFTQDLSMFLVGKSIPEHIRNLPQTFLETPFGQMMKPQIEMALKGVTQGTGQVGVPGPSAQPPTARAPPTAPQNIAQPAHPHRQLRLPSLQREISNFVMYKKAPPLEKLIQKLPTEFQEAEGVPKIIEFVKLRHSATPVADIRVPDLHSFAATLKLKYSTLPSDTHFAVVDLVRLLLLDPRVSGYFAEEAQHATILTMLEPLSQDETASYPYNLRIVALQLACNLFNTPLYPEQLISSSSPLRETCLRLATNSLLDSQTSLRVVAASFAYNLASFNHNARFSNKSDPISEEDQVELTASLLEAVSREEESVEALHGLLYALGLIVYEAPMDGSVIDLCRAMGVAETISGKMDIHALQKEPLLKEIGGELFQKGL
ncbi:uncharacterized protein N7511_006233 [Penicillium nucicola]|uniref:uncharacterized protein n=1 Tax=Penicillium nucicola TaxID=1850975 RepID=UPI00254581FE|nr:uncharacterized protein N7511_006233 [Penicillium nucicola]KAJ5757539.1 hypothetical protein N7511_006233 [Penicillium nucicola]